MNADQWKVKFSAVHRACNQGDGGPLRQLCEQLAEMDKKFEVIRQPIPEPMIEVPVIAFQELAPQPHME